MDVATENGKISVSFNTQPASAAIVCSICNQSICTCALTLVDLSDKNPVFFLYVCEVCEMGFVNIDDFNAHTCDNVIVVKMDNLQQQQEQSVNCLATNNINNISTQNSCSKNKNSTAKCKVACKICLLRLSKHDYDAHWDNCHPLIDRSFMIFKYVKCKHCHAYFKDVCTLFKHFNQSHKIFACTHCAWRGSNTCSQDYHIRSVHACRGLTCKSTTLKTVQRKQQNSSPQIDAVERENGSGGGTVASSLQFPDDNSADVGDNDNVKVMQLRSIPRSVYQQSKLVKRTTLQPFVVHPLIYVADKKARRKTLKKSTDGVVCVRKSSDEIKTTDDKTSASVNENDTVMISDDLQEQLGEIRNDTNQVNSDNNNEENSTDNNNFRKRGYRKPRKPLKMDKNFFTVNGIVGYEIKFSNDIADQPVESSNFLNPDIVSSSKFTLHVKPGRKAKRKERNAVDRLLPLLLNGLDTEPKEENDMTEKAIPPSAVLVCENSKNPEKEFTLTRENRDKQEHRYCKKLTTPAARRRGGFSQKCFDKMDKTKTKYLNLRCTICARLMEGPMKYRQHFKWAHPGYPVESMFDTCWKCTICDSVQKSFRIAEVHVRLFHRNHKNPFNAGLIVPF